MSLVQWYEILQATDSTLIHDSVNYQRQILVNIEKHSNDERQLRRNWQRQLRTNAGDARVWINFPHF